MGLVDGKAVVVLGATSGIGAATARLLTDEGATVVLAGRRVDEGQALAAQLGASASFVSCDVLVESSVAALMQTAHRRLGRIDGLVNCAGDAGALGGIAGVDLRELERTLAVHLGGTVAAMKHAAPILLEQGCGSIVNVASVGGRIAGWTGVAYSAAKAAVIQATRSAAIELGEQGVRANSVSPGPVLTGIFGKAAGLDPAAADRQAGELEPVFTAALSSWQTLRRAGEPDDVAPVCAWLVSDAARFVNGHDLIVDGGISAGRPVSVSIAERQQMAGVFRGGVRPATASRHERRLVRGVTAHASQGCRLGRHGRDLYERQVDRETWRGGCICEGVGGVRDVGKHNAWIGHV
jgi:NAD(P)-dependent dehydrogenase (short-subunit alcohol dehydrogenase family)